MTEPAGTRSPRLAAVTPMLPLAAAAALVGVAVLRFLTDAPGEELLAVIPIALLAMMFGARGGVIAAVFASAVFLGWASGHHVSTLDYVDQPLAFFTLGTVTGFYAHGALGDYDVRRHRLRRRLLRAISRGEIEMHYQPVVETTRGETVAVEALARWRPPGEDLVAPAEFVPAAERDLNTIRALTLHTFELAVAYGAGHLSEPIGVAVNLSPAALQDRRVVQGIARILREAAFPPERLQVEITETAFAADPDAVAGATRRIKELGVGKVLIDDFGVGQSSLARLGALRVDALKIDHVLIADLQDPEFAAVIGAIVQLAHGLGLTVVAEGVEDADTGRELRRMGCDALQGFHLSRPLPGEDLDTWLLKA